MRAAAAGELRAIRINLRGDFRTTPAWVDGFFGKASGGEVRS